MDPRFSLPYLWGLEQPFFSTQTEVLYKTSPAPLCFKFDSFPLSHMRAWGDTQRDMNLFSALLKLQHCPQIILTQRQCSSVHQTAHFALSKDTFPCMEWSPTVSHKSAGLAGEIESKAFQDNSPPETIETNRGSGCGWTALDGATSIWMQLMGLGSNPIALLLWSFSWQHGVCWEDQVLCVSRDLSVSRAQESPAALGSVGTLANQPHRWSPSCLANGDGGEG